jgi:hypothetical protein
MHDDRNLYPGSSAQAVVMRWLVSLHHVQGEGDLLGASSSSSRMQGGEEALMPLYTSEVAQRAAQQVGERERVRGDHPGAESDMTLVGVVC